MIEDATSIHQSAMELVGRLAAEGPVCRQSSRVDRRQIRIRLTARGPGFLERLSAAHKDELRRIAPSLRQILAQLRTAES